MPKHSKENVMPKPDIGKPCIRFRIEGIIAICAGERKKSFDVGVVRTVGGGGNAAGEIPGHAISITVRKNGRPFEIPDLNNSNLPKALSLIVVDQPSSGGIEFYTPTIFNRNHRREDYHFKWALDMGNGELHSNSVAIKKEALRSVLHVRGIESAIFYTDNLSEKPLKIRDGLGERNLGSIAGAIEALTPLSQGGAVFIVGANSYRLVYERNVIYDIAIKQVCSKNKDCSLADVESIYKKLFRTRSGEEIDICGVEPDRESPDSTPEIGCVGLNFSANTELPPAA
jgi:hypothetical protein